MHLVSGADVFLSSHFTHSSKLEEALVVEVVLNAEVITIPVQTNTSSVRRTLETSLARCKLHLTSRSSPTYPHRYRFFCLLRSRTRRISPSACPYTATAGLEEQCLDTH